MAEIRRRSKVRISELSDETKTKIEERIKAGDYYRNIARDFNLPYHFVQYYAKVKGITNGRKRESAVKVTDEMISEIQRLNAAGLTRSAMAMKLGINYNAVTRILTTLNLKPNMERPGFLCKFWHTRLKEVQKEGDADSIFLSKDLMREFFDEAPTCYDYDKLGQFIIIPKDFDFFFGDMDDFCYNEWAFLDKYSEPWVKRYGKYAYK